MARAGALANLRAMRSRSASSNVTPGQFDKQQHPLVAVMALAAGQAFQHFFHPLDLPVDFRRADAHAGLSTASERP